MVFERVPQQNMQKRPASQDAGMRPDMQRQKHNSGVALTGAGRDIASMGSTASEIFNTAESRDAAAKAEDTPVPDGESPATRHPSSQQRHSHLPKRSMQTVTIEAELLDQMLTLLLQSSRRLNDLEATSYYTHMIPTSSEMCMRIDQVYQGYLVTAQENKPPAIHRGIALLRQVMNWEESFQKKDGLKVMWPVVKAALDELSLEETDLSESQSIVGHCKISQMYDKTRTRLTFSLPQIVTCGHKTHTLGSVVSRLLRSFGYERKIGAAPDGYLNRKLSDTLNTLRE